MYTPRENERLLNYVQLPVSSGTFLRGTLYKVEAYISINVLTLLYRHRRDIEGTESSNRVQGFTCTPLLLLLSIYRKKSFEKKSKPLLKNLFNTVVRFSHFRILHESGPSRACRLPMPFRGPCGILSGRCNRPVQTCRHRGRL